ELGLGEVVARIIDLPAWPAVRTFLGDDLPHWPAYRTAFVLWTIALASRFDEYSYLRDRCRSVPGLRGARLDRLARVVRWLGVRNYTRLVRLWRHARKGAQDVFRRIAP